MDIVQYKARKFVKKSYEENDKFAKDLLIKFIIKNGCTIISHSENFNHDIIAEKNGIRYFFEVEVKTGYPFKLKDSFIFKTVSFLGRKKRLHDIQPFYYVIICRETKYALVAYSGNIYKEEFVEEININSRDRTGNDLMYRVPKDLCTFFCIDDK